MIGAQAYVQASRHVRPLEAEYSTPCRLGEKERAREPANALATTCSHASVQSTRKQRQSEQASTRGTT